MFITHRTRERVCGLLGVAACLAPAARASGASEWLTPKPTLRSAAAVVLRAQLDHARSIRFAKKELIWLAGNTFYGKTQMFSPDFINWLANFRLPEYELNKVDGQYELHFHGHWTHTTMWEIPALAILNELRSRQTMKPWWWMTARRTRRRSWWRGTPWT